MGTFWHRAASHCCICASPLTDSTSIQFGIGPTCRKKYKYEDALDISPDQVMELAVWSSTELPVELMTEVNKAAASNNSRRCANLLVYYASAEDGIEAVKAAHALRIIGYGLLADRVQDRLSAVSITSLNGEIAVRTGYDPVFIAALKRRYVPGRRWEPTEKVWIMPDNEIAFEVVSAAITEAFSGRTGVGPKGPFKI